MVPHDVVTQLRGPLHVLPPPRGTDQIALVQRSHIRLTVYRLTVCITQGLYILPSPKFVVRDEPTNDNVDNAK